MKIYPQLGKSDRNNPQLPANGSEEPEYEELKNDLRIFRDSLRGAVEKTDTFWAKQRAGIMEKLQSSVPVSARRPALLWAPALVVVVLCLFLFVEKSKAPTPDIAAGSDQTLLVDVERALERRYPEALAPAALIAWEIEHASRANEHPLVKK